MAGVKGQWTEVPVFLLPFGSFWFSYFHIFIFSYFVVVDVDVDVTFSVGLTFGLTSRFCFDLVAWVFLLLFFIFLCVLIISPLCCCSNSLVWQRRIVISDDVSRIDYSLQWSNWTRWLFIRLLSVIHEDSRGFTLIHEDSRWPNGRCWLAVMNERIDDGINSLGSIDLMLLTLIGHFDFKCAV